MKTTFRGVKACVRSAIKTAWMYRVGISSDVVTLLLRVWLLLVVWNAVYGGAEMVSGIDRQQAVSYAILAACLQVALIPWYFSGLEARVRTGQVGIDMMRPLGLIPQVLGQNFGTLVARLPITAIGLAWAMTLGALSLPPAPEAVVIWLISTALGMGLSLLMNLLMSMTCFWSLEIGGYTMPYRLGSGLLSGALIPLWFMPDWLVTTLEWLPFRAQMFTPLGIYFGKITGDAAWTEITVQAAWMATVSGLLILVWSRSKHKVVVLGG